MESCVENPFIGLFEKIHRPPEHPIMLRFQMGHKVFLSVPLFKKKESIYIPDTLVEIAALASLLHPYGTGH
jgi:hypothetical protein